jgi:amino acid transporter
MAVGGMVGGGIFSTLGVVIGISGSWAWLAFLSAGLIALLAGYSYVSLAKRHGEGGGAFTFLREMGDDGIAGSLAWVLIIGYVLTNAVYAFTFGQYLAHVTGLGPWFPRAAAIAIVSLFVIVNIRGVGEASALEIVLVWFKLVVLVGLAAWGLGRWRPDLLSQGVTDAGPAAALLGAASVFMAYEGFQLLTYDYDDIDQPRRVLPRAVLSAIVVVIGVYVVVALGTPMLVGADVVVEQQEVALAVAGEEAAGIFGLVLVTVAAAFSTGSAINATLFATARLTHIVAKAGELPAWVDHLNDDGIPDRAVVLLGASSALLAAIGSLATLVEAASLAFLGTFAVVGALAFQENIGHRALTMAGAVGAAAATVGLAWRLATTEPIVLAAFGVLVFAAVALRPILLARVETE